ncbi:Homeobox [Macrophomina phaseolina MS6]|uniref:Homeobox n=1 Tax=Macrophomina phaseolina (strain MS6) TaxID=1126212 RepID=K2S5A0_MACPH|nr:Homeobox [Macrophomina phaseolina MS6]
MDRRRHAAHDDNGNNNMQPYFHHHDALMQQWPDPMQVDMHQHHHHQQQQQQPDDISSWNYGGSATPDWWLSQASQDQFNQFAHFPPQPSGGWPVDHYPSPAALDYQGVPPFHPSATLPPADFSVAIPSDAQLISGDELDSLLNPQPLTFPSDLELSHAEYPQRSHHHHHLQQHQQQQQKVRQRISSPAKAILQKWFDDHIEDPYLEREDVSTLSEATGLTPRQVRTFFANARARKLPGPAISSQHSPPDSSGRDARGAVSRTPSFKPKQKHGSNVPSSVKPDSGAQQRMTPCPGGQQSPMQRYLSSSPEDEGVSEAMLRSTGGGGGSSRALQLLLRHCEHG